MYGTLYSSKYITYSLLTMDSHYILIMLSLPISVRQHLLYEKTKPVVVKSKDG